tara:strand:+ start:2684 stop:3085 length:402 start_codon:yes stop_codon:yes gene_type:complete
MQFYGISLFFVFLVVACSSSQNSRNSVFPSRFHLDVSKDILETLDGNTFVAHVRGVNPVFGRALKIKVRGLVVESVSETNSSKVSTAFRQWHQFRQILKESKTVEIRNLERSSEGFWVWADVYIDGSVLEDFR